MVPLIVCRFAHVAPLRRPYSFENELVAIGALKDPDQPLVVLIGASKDYRPLAVVAERLRGEARGRSPCFGSAPFRKHTHVWLAVCQVADTNQNRPLSKSN
jgi:hypothetical protein